MKAFDVGIVTEGFSEYDDYVWRWLQKRRFSSYGTGVDCVGAWGLFILAGCTIERVGEQEEDALFRIVFPGTRFLLFKRLNRLMEGQG
jgi:hypothetical protein